MTVVMMNDTTDQLLKNVVKWKKSFVQRKLLNVIENILIETVTDTVSMMITDVTDVKTDVTIVKTTIVKIEE